MRPFPRPFQGGVRSSELLIASLHLGTSLGELPLRVYAICISWRVGEVLVFWWTLPRREQEAERGVPYQDDRKIRLGLVNMNDVLFFENCMMHVCEESKCPRLNRNYMYIALEMEDSSGTQADSMDCCRRRVEGLHGGIARCMVRCYKDRAVYGWGLPTQGCEFLEIERGSLGAGSVA
ncbi:hypothetical protein CDL15_Pgr027353 [Punica granatum]|nr:hypothetical protein CDL15_Pgr008081 [Punica granatum]OWM73821.1 hypothetical protein CDL15_Pgr015121 [Punica granatum]OWM77047.1 hypothetical protein CDL15_Pgr019846 [Punica granatum]OWM90866.1 hypothetical protein CDL15_Pgr027353 [Punica granatum]